MTKTMAQLLRVACKANKLGDSGSSTVLLKRLLATQLTFVMLGEVADELLLAGQKVLPKRLEAAGFSFHYPDIDSAVGQLVGKP